MKIDLLDVFFGTISRIRSGFQCIHPSRKFTDDGLIICKKCNTILGWTNEEGEKKIRKLRSKQKLPFSKRKQVGK